MKLRLKISLTVLLLLLTLCTTIIYSCSSEDYDFEDNSEELKVTRVAYKVGQFWLNLLQNQMCIWILL